MNEKYIIKFRHTSTTEYISNYEYDGNGNFSYEDCNRFEDAYFFDSYEECLEVATELNNYEIIEISFKSILVEE